MQPKVSFIVPCYKLAHLLSACVHSILSQTYSNFEVLIMDDCSPDHTPEVAQSFQDARVKHIRHEHNMGHLRNYNRGIELARGEYIWLISADDCLRRPYVLERFVRVLDTHPEVGYVFCPAMTLQDEQETDVMQPQGLGCQDTILAGHAFLHSLLEVNSVPAPAAMARKACYEQLSFFPLNMPHAGDWYLWCLFALHHDVAYCVEPMVYRRLHAQNMSKFFMEHFRRLYADEIAVLWGIKARAEAAAYAAVVARCKDVLAARYAQQIAPPPTSLCQGTLTWEEVELSLQEHTQKAEEITEIRMLTAAILGDHYYCHGDLPQALHYYTWVMQEDYWTWRTWAKYSLLRMGDLGICLRNAVIYLRERSHVRRLPLGANSPKTGTPA